MTLKMPEFPSWMSETRTEKIMGISIREFSRDYLAGKLQLMNKFDCKCYCLGEYWVFEGPNVRRTHDTIPNDIWESIDRGDVTIQSRRLSKRCL